MSLYKTRSVIFGVAILGCVNYVYYEDMALRKPLDNSNVSEAVQDRYKLTMEKAKSISREIEVGVDNEISFVGFSYESEKRIYIEACGYFEAFSKITIDASTGKTWVSFKGGSEKLYSIKLVNLNLPVGYNKPGRFEPPLPEFIPDKGILVWDHKNKKYFEGWSIEIYSAREIGYEELGHYDVLLEEAFQESVKMIEEAANKFSNTVIAERDRDSYEDEESFFAFTISKFGKFCFYKVAESPDISDGQRPFLVVTAAKEVISNIVKSVGADHNGVGGISLVSPLELDEREFKINFPISFKATLFGGLGAEHGYLRLDPPIGEKQILSYCDNKKVRLYDFEEAIVTDLKAVIDDIIKVISPDKRLIIHDNLKIIFEKIGIKLPDYTTLQEVKQELEIFDRGLSDMVDYSITIGSSI